MFTGIGDGLSASTTIGKERVFRTLPESTGEPGASAKPSGERLTERHNSAPAHHSMRGQLPVSDSAEEERRLGSSDTITKTAPPNTLAIRPVVPNAIPKHHRSSAEEYTAIIPETNPPNMANLHKNTETVWNNPL
ncbi:hypothetical protein [Donghicola eburneus]|uniref:Uncharacterized protein n=1 Tax=Donghicola eburneus TaxID=393278 RepID=A0A1M4MV21_9RHOB|nr:hypothetical protein [Donghicola eburneus]SCM66050.1 hypothetical protein KARMA_0222 [Donghicola eburneus]